MRRILLLIFCQCISTLSYCQNIFGFSYYTNEEDSVIVTKVFKNSPADKAGLKNGDYLNFLNDIPLTNNKKDELTKIFENAPVNNNELRYYRNGEVYKTIIAKVPLSSFEFSCLSTNCNNGMCEMESVLGYTIKGNCTDGFINGDASIYVNGQLQYKGAVVKNKKDGFGIEYYENNARYEGNYKNGIRDGNGKLFFKDDSYLIAQWKNGKIEGKAQLFDATNTLTSTRIYKNGKMESEDKVGNKQTENTSTTSSTKTLTKNPDLINSILKDKTTSWDFDFFSEKYPDAIPKKQKLPFDKKDYKEVAAAAGLTPDALKKVVEQCAYENWPTFFKTYKDINSVFKFAFRNLMIRNVVTIRADKDDGEYRSYGLYTIIFIEDKENKHAPKELLSDDGIGYFMCVDAEIIQKFMNPNFNYKPFTITNPFKGGGFGNWASKKEVYLIDMVSIEDQYYNSGWSFSDKEVQTKLGLSDEEFKKLKELCDVKYRPDGLKTAQNIKDAQRNAIFVDMKAYALADLTTTNLIFVPKNENYHLPQNMQPKSSDGWFFCTKSFVNTTQPSSDYVMKIKATTDAKMAQFEIDQAARQEKMKQDAAAKYEWAAKNKFKGVVIIQYANEYTNNNNYDNESHKYNVITIFGPPSSTIDESDYEALLAKYKKYYFGYKYVAIKFEEGMNEVQATQKANDLTNTHKFSVNTNFSYTIPEFKNQSSSNNGSTLKKLDEELKEIEKERDKISKEIIEDKTMEKSAMRQKAMTDIFSNKKSINNPATVEVVYISTSDKYYTENKKFIGKSGTIEATLTENGDGTYYGTIQFPNEKYSTIFYSVKVKIIE